MRINAKNQELIMIDGQGVAEAVDEFTYLGATVCKEEGAGMKDPKNRLSKARSALVRLKRIWRSKTILRRAKLYRTLVVPVLLYGCETWKVNKGDDRAVDWFHNNCLRRILQIQWAGPCQYWRAATKKEQIWNLWVKKWSSVDGRWLDIYWNRTKTATAT